MALKRTHTCGQLRSGDAGQEAALPLATLGENERRELAGVTGEHGLAVIAVAVAGVAEVGGVFPWRKWGGNEGLGAIDAGLEVLRGGLPGGAVGAGHAEAGGSLRQHSGDGGAAGLAQLWISEGSLSEGRDGDGEEQGK